MNFSGKIDLHIHTLVSDGTESPEEIISSVKKAGIGLFSVTDHDAVKGCVTISSLLKDEDPLFVNGVEFSCRDREGKYHILGYGYDPEAGPMKAIINKGHEIRLMKVKERLQILERNYGFVFSDEELDGLFSNYNPGKPHIANMMVSHGYVESFDEAMKGYLNKLKFKSEVVEPKEAISAILGAGGIPVLAHPSYGSGSELILGDDMDQRLKKLISFGIMGLEAFYSGFTAKIQKQVLSFAEKYDLYVTAGSDYHGTNKLVRLGDTNLEEKSDCPLRLMAFLDELKRRGSIYPVTQKECR